MPIGSETHLSSPCSALHLPQPSAVRTASTAASFALSTAFSPFSLSSPALLNFRAKSVCLAPTLSFLLSFMIAHGLKPTKD